MASTMPPSFRASFSPACKITGVKFVMFSTLQGNIALEIIVHVALMRNMS
jgi:hypothetical protein